MTTAQPTIYVFNGPNLNLLGTRDPETYGHQTLDDLKTFCTDTAQELGVALDFRQTNHEGELIEWIHEAGFEVRNGNALGLVLNAGAWTHTSIALADAVSGVSLPMVEVHLSNVYAREEFRHRSYLSAVAEGVIAGLGFTGYEAGMRALAKHRS